MEYKSNNIFKRISNGYSLQTALTAKTNREECKDHLGNKYKSISEMCNTYKIETTTYLDRINRGWNLERALTEEATHEKVSSKFSCRDHKGNTYTSISSMCSTYGIGRSLYTYRIRKGWSMQTALETPINGRNKVKASKI